MASNCLYFIACIERKKVVTFIALLRSIEDHLVFDRTIDKVNSIFEFFVPIGMVKRFIFIMEIFKKNKIIEYFEEKKIEDSSIFKY
jgi:hypothetical protein